MKEDSQNLKRKHGLPRYQWICHVFFHNDHWWLGCVLEKYPDDGEVKLTLLQPKGPSSSFCYPLHPKILRSKKADILSSVHPITETGRTYKVSKREMKNASIILEKKI